MISGMLWFHDNNSLDLKKRLEQAIDDYLQCYGVRPSICCLNPLELQQQKPLVHRLGLNLAASEQLRPGQFWLGER